MRKTVVQSGIEILTSTILDVIPAWVIQLNGEVGVHIGGVEQAPNKIALIFAGS